MNPAIEPLATSARPMTVTRAVQLFYASFAIGSIKTVFDLAHKMSGVILILAIVFAFIFLGICCFFVNRIGAGRNWARIVFLVLLIIGLPLSVPQYLAELRTSPIHGGVSVLVAILQVIGIVLLFTKSSNQWFRKLK